MDSWVNGIFAITLFVQDLVVAKAFYQKVFEVKVMYHRDDFLQVTTPGANDIIVFEQKKADHGKTGGIAHFGFRLRDAKDIDEMARRIKSAGGTIIDKGEFVPGEPYVFFKDPDGYEVEICYELIEE